MNWMIVAILFVALIGGAIYLLIGSNWRFDQTSADDHLERVTTDDSRSKSPSLEAQVEAFARLGLVLDDGVTIEDLLYSFEETSFQENPYYLLLFVLGTEVEREPWDRPFSQQVWNFDLEAIEGPGSYVRIVEQLARLTGQPDIVAGVFDEVDMDAATGRIGFTIDGQSKNYVVRIDDDWADPEVVIAIMKDIEGAIGDGRRFWAADNGQASILVFVDRATASEINRLRPGLIGKAY